MLEVDEKPRRAILLAVQQPNVSDEELARSLDELRQMAKTLGIEVVDRVTQKIKSFDRGGYLGPGKRTELKKLIDGPEPDPTDENAAPHERFADTLLVEHEISPSQMRNLEKEMDCEVLDRTQVILEIFHLHARSRSAKLQVEIVRLQYLAPRMRESTRGKDRQRGGIGGKGSGESKMETDRRKIRDRVTELREELAAIDVEQLTQRQRRSDRSGIRRVALVGYTNAGKSSWMRALTGSEVYVADKLFATLDTTVRTLEPESVPRVLVSDTVGFIRNLPHGLVASFKSTLDEALEASLLVHIIDAADPDWERQMQVTDEVLREIGAGEVPRFIVFNKIDRVADEAEMRATLLARWPDAYVLSALRATDVDSFRATLQAHFSSALVETEVRLGWDQQKLRSEIFENCQVLNERAEDDGAYFTVRAAPETIARLQSLLAS